MEGSSQEDFLLKEIKPQVGVTAANPDEQMQYLYVYVMKARGLPVRDMFGTIEPYVEIRVGSCNATTQNFEKKRDPVWNQVFSFSKDRIQSSVLDVTVKDEDDEDVVIGRVSFDLNEIPVSIPRDVSLAPQWYRLKDRMGQNINAELMLAVWMGAQGNDTFSEASTSRSKVYFSPRLWYLRVNVIEAQDLVPNDKSRSEEVFVKAITGNQVQRTRVSMNKTISNPMWNEDLMFVVAEPFEEFLILSVEDKEEVLGRCIIPLQNMERRSDNRPLNSRWYNLEGKELETKISSRIHVRIYLEGGYHVLDESTHYSSDLRPAAKQLWKSKIGVLELGILRARELVPMKMRGPSSATDAYCVAKYGQKWVRTRTVTDSFSPEWNEQYTWEVFDPNTVITIGVFDDSNLQGGYKSAMARDSRIGKVRIRLSTLETGRVYAHSYPLLGLLPSGVKKMGEIQLSVRFTCSSLLNMMHTYSQPMMPKMHYVQPLTVAQLDGLRHQATQIVSMRLSRAEPPLGKEVVEYMLDQKVGSHTWSMRKSKANFFRIMALISGVIDIARWFDQICSWKSPSKTVLVHILFLILVAYPRGVPAIIFLYLPLRIAYLYTRRPRHPPFLDTRLSLADSALPDELDEEFDTFPTSKPADVVRMRYDRVRSIAGRIQTVVGDIATQGERVLALIHWRDPRATTLFLILYSLAGIVIYVTPFQVVAILTGLYVLRHPIYRHKLPSAPLNFFRRLPSKTDLMM